MSKNDDDALQSAQENYKWAFNGWEQCKQTCDLLRAENEAQAKQISELERLCDATYVAKGADAYNHACDEM